MSSPITESPVRSRCNHSEVEDLGSAGIVEFYRCTRCRDVVVVQGSRRWAVTAVLAVLWSRRDLRLVLLSLVAFGILVAQVWLGALTITSSLNWVIVTIHLALGTATFAFGLLVALFALRLPPVGAASPRPIG